MSQVCSDLPRNREQPGTTYGSLALKVLQFLSAQAPATTLQFKLLVIPRPILHACVRGTRWHLCLEKRANDLTQALQRDLALSTAESCYRNARQTSYKVSDWTELVGMHRPNWSRISVCEPIKSPVPYSQGHLNFDKIYAVDVGAVWVHNAIPYVAALS